MVTLNLDTFSYDGHISSLIYRCFSQLHVKPRKLARHIYKPYFNVCDALIVAYPNAQHVRVPDRLALPFPPPFDT